MPRTQRPAEPSTALTVPSDLPEDIRNELLQAQAGSITTPQRLPQAKVMAAGAGMFQFTDTQDVERTFRGVILSNHANNVLWDKKFGTQVSDEEKFPACASPDGLHGVPRPGFRHAALGGAPADGTELIECRTCPYNKWGSGAELIHDRNPKGKAVTNQRPIYVAMEDREAPIELVLPPTSIKGFDDYLTMLLNQQLPVQAVLTEFSQVIQGQGSAPYGVVHFRALSALDLPSIHQVLEMKRRYAAQIEPAVLQVAGTPGAAAASEVEPSEREDDDLPF